MRASLIAILTWVFLFVGVAVGFLTELNMSSIVLQVLGWTLFILGSYIHYLSHKAHPKAHKGINEINYIAQRGIYSWVRHPGYLGLTLMFFGVAIAFGSVPALIIAAILTPITISSLTRRKG